MARFCSPKCRGGYQTNIRQQKIDALERLKENEERLQKKWNDESIEVRECPQNSQYSKEIWAYLKRGGTITKYLHAVWAKGAVIDEHQEEILEI